MTEKEVFYPAEEYYKKQNNCEFYLVKTDYKLLMIDDIVRILNNQRETIQYHRKTEKQLEKEHTRLTNQLRLSYDKINKLTDENKQLKQQLQRMYDVATLNKAIDVLENKYDKMLSDGSDEVKDAMRHTVLRCIEDLDELKDDITAR
jgi:predicted nuclease with TOPRIM domain